MAGVGKTFTLSGLAKGGIVGSAISSLLNPKKPATPTIAAPTVMPLPDDAMAQAAAKKQMQARSQASGRASTLVQGGNAGFSGGSTTMGG
jgi:hypothetical protein